MAWEYSDTLHMAPMVYLAAGDLATARRYAQQRSELPFFREADHLAVEWLLTTAALAGDFDEAVELAERFRRGWVEAGRPPLGGIGFAPAAAAMVYGIRGDDEARLEWLDIPAEMRRVVEPTARETDRLRPAFDAMVALHRGQIGEALDARGRRAGVVQAAGTTAPGGRGTPPSGPKPVCSRPCPTDAAVSTGRGSSSVATRSPRRSSSRAEAIDAGDTDGLLAAAAALDAAGCRYQRARTLVFAGGEHAPRARRSWRRSAPRRWQARLILTDQAATVTAVLHKSL